MDIASILQMMGMQGMGQQMPMPQTPPTGAGYGIGQPVVAGQMGNASYAAAPEQPSILSQLLGGAGAAAALQNPGAALMGQGNAAASPVAALLQAYLARQGQQQQQMPQPFTAGGSLQHLQMQRQPRISF